MSDALTRTIDRFKTACDPWEPDAKQDTVTINRADAYQLLNALTNAAPATVTLAFAKLDLDPADVGHDLDDDRCELGYHDGPLLVVEDYDEHDPDAIREVAAWFDALAKQAGELADQLRDQALAICEDCNGYGTVEIAGGDERDCRVCGGTGRAA